ncbi:MAG: hypothetical protein NXI07_11155, partial [bacterium]|nr:hypothetical protein [bacterium]
GLTDHPPRFAEPVETLGERIKASGEKWVQRVRDGVIGGQKYSMRPGEQEKLRKNDTDAQNPTMK